MSRERLGHILALLHEVHDGCSPDTLAARLECFIALEFNHMKGIIMSLDLKVQALLDAVAVQGAAITDAATELTKVEGMVADLQKQLADLQANPQPIDADDLAAIASATDAINASVQTLKGAMPQPVAPATVQGVAAAPTPGAT